MWRVPKKYQTACSTAAEHKMIFQREYEALDKNEAMARAYLNCVKENNNKSDIVVSAKRI